MGTTEKTTLTLNAELKTYAEKCGWNLSELWNDAARRRKARDEQAVGIVYTTADRHTRMQRAIEIIQSQYHRRGGIVDDLEARIDAQYVATHQAKVLGELWPDVEFNGTQLHRTVRRELKLPDLPTDKPNEEKKT